MATALRNVVVVGGSYVGLSAARELANLLPATHRVVLVEPHSHFHHLFAFPRFATTPSHAHKAFIPYTSTFTTSPNPTHHLLLHARALTLHPHSLTLDRAWHGSHTLPFDYLIVATGTHLSPPGTMPTDDKVSSVEFLRRYQKGVEAAREVVIVGGGAVGVQMACDVKEGFPGKRVVLVHSRERLMKGYHGKLSALVRGRFEELGVEVVSGSRAVVPEGGWPSVFGGGGDGEKVEVGLQDGRVVTGDLVIPATGQTPNTGFVAGLEGADELGSVVNPQNEFVRVRPTMQFADGRYPHLFAVGDIADSGAHKAAKPGMVQAAVAAKNIASMVAGREAAEEMSLTPAGIHLTLGLTRNVIFRNPNIAAGETEPYIELKDDGREDMNIERVWTIRGVTAKSPQDYHL
ncbi:uncharacterized protein B0H64DRAFT_366362 [Chaetomium fimeti]|uniref:FAD/NAD(P)-binding domain-containing protein n=1 Tax=Chaetomium fimeti TaxID=1854472 RepID=A0AAE0H8H1_9PEZI|nr:hypothetical protein B0H64DRAFT_366362 [Chaetomium fimeti]